MSAESIARTLGGIRQGRAFLCRCPVPTHGRGKGDRNPSLKVVDDPRKDDGLDVHCFAGCDWRDVKGALRTMHMAEHRPRPAAAPKVDEEQDRWRARFVAKTWRKAEPVPGTLAETYLRGRGITLAPPPTLRFCPSLAHKPTGMFLPAMVAAVQAPNRSIVALHRTFLRLDGNGKAPVSAPKRALGPFEAGAVRLAAAAPTLGLAEGIESALSAQQLFSLPVWAALGRRLGAVELPDIVSNVVLFADRGTPGEAAAEVAERRHRAAGRRVTVRFPDHGEDWNDDLRARMAA